MGHDWTVPFVQDLGHHVLKGDVPREHSGRSSGLDEPPGLSASSPLQGEGELPSSWPRGVTAPATSLRSGCVVPCGRRLHFDLLPAPSGGWERLFAWRGRRHRPAIPGETFQYCAIAPPLRCGLISRQHAGTGEEERGLTHHQSRPRAYHGPEERSHGTAERDSELLRRRRSRARSTSCRRSGRRSVLAGPGRAPSITAVPAGLVPSQSLQERLAP